MTSDLVALIRDKLADASHVRWPSPKYRDDPVAFFREVLGVEPWSKQIEIIEAVRDNLRVAVSSGHKISKSHTAAGLALWFYCSWEDARAIMSSTTSRQVDQILWRELTMMRARGGRCVQCKRDDPDGLVIRRPCPHSSLIDGELGGLARTGLKADDFREIVGFTSRETEGIAGISGRNVLYILDEASGIPDPIHEAIAGNSAGGARCVMFGNPTKNEGEFFEAFYGKSHLYKSIRVSSEETPNVVQGRIVIPGLATREWIDLKREEWGEDSPLYRVRVKGEHALNEGGRIFNLHLIATAEQRWHDTAEAGRLYIGLDPAGDSGTGDNTVFAPRRGLKLLALREFLGLNEDQHLVQLLLLIQEFRLPRETPVVVVDREGPVGARVVLALRMYQEQHPAAFEIVTVRASDAAKRKPKLYDRWRDELAGNLQQWFRDGGAIPEDPKLEKELHVWEWFQHVNGKAKLTPKPKARKALGRSPDRYDALALSVWEPLSLAETDADGTPAAVQPLIAREADAAYGGTGMDPYAGSAAWQPR